jgi:putative SOS response-associated peptidase YedK
MCNRFAFATSPEELGEMRDTLGLVDLDKELLTPRYNIAPTTQIAVARTSASGARELARMRLGLIPSWQKPGEKFPFLTNARSETAATKPSFRSAFKKRRCIIPASGFYEWKTVGKEKFPYYIRMKTGLMPFAGLWERWETRAGLKELGLSEDVGQSYGSSEKNCHTAAEVKILGEVSTKTSHSRLI